MSHCYLAESHTKFRRKCIASLVLSINFSTLPTVDKLAYEPYLYRFKVRYDIDPITLGRNIKENLAEAAERKDLIRHLQRRESYLIQKLVEGN